MKTLDESLNALDKPLMVECTQSFNGWKWTFIFALVCMFAHVYMYVCICIAKNKVIWDNLARHC